MVFWIWSAVLQAATPGELDAAIQAFNTGAVFALPVLDDQQLSQLSDGEVVSLLTRGDAEEVWRAVGMVVADASQKAVWLSCQDLHFTNVERVTELRLEGGAHTDRAVWYGHMDLPLPVSDRHWVVEVWNNHALSAATQGQMWEHPWRLQAGALGRVRSRVVEGKVGALTPEIFDASIFTPINDGAWVAIRLSLAETLLVYHGATDIGGVLPGRLVAQFNASGMHSMLEGVVARAKQDVPSHYRGAHAPVFGGDGQPIPLFP